MSPGSRIAVLCGLFLVQAAAAQLPVVTGEPALTPKAAAPQLRAAPAKIAAARIDLPDIAAEAEERVLEANLRLRDSKMRAAMRRVVIGVVRAAEGPAVPSGAGLPWISVQGGYVARVAVASPGAESLRLAIDLAGAPSDLGMMFFGSADPSRLEGPIRAGDIRDRSLAWWSPITEGDVQTVE